MDLILIENWVRSIAKEEALKEIEKTFKEVQIFTKGEECRVWMEYTATIRENVMTVRTANILEKAGAETVFDLARMRQQDVSKIKGCGKRAIEECRNMLKKYGLSFAK